MSSPTDDQLLGCISHVFEDHEERLKRLKAQEEFIKAEAEKVGAVAEYKSIMDMSETEFIVKSALMEQGEEFNEII